MFIQPYLFFDGKCEEAINFYRTALGAEATMLMRYKDSPDPNSCPPGSAEKVMHASVRIGETTVLMSDGHCTGKPVFQGFSLTITAKTDTEAEKVFGLLSNGGKVTMPLTKTFFSSKFGMLSDRFNVGWMIIVEHKA